MFANRERQNAIENCCFVIFFTIPLSVQHVKPKVTWLFLTKMFVYTYTYILGIALTDLHCFSTLRLKFRDTDIMYWNGNFNFKVIRCLWKMLQQKIHFWHFINIFFLRPCSKSPFVTAKVWWEISTNNILDKSLFTSVNIIVFSQKSP